MSLGLYFDEHVHRAIATGLRLRNVEVLTVQEDHRCGLDDAQVIDRATELSRPLFSQDDDLLAEARRRQLAGVPFSGVIFAHQLHTSIGRCVNDLELIAKVCSPADLAGRVEFLPL